MLPTGNWKCGEEEERERIKLPPQWWRNNNKTHKSETTRQACSLPTSLAVINRAVALVNVVVQADEVLNDCRGQKESTATATLRNFA